MIRDTCQSPWQQPLSSNIITYNHQKVFVNELIVNSIFIDLVFMLPLLCCCMNTRDLLLSWNSIYYPFIPIVTVSVLLLLFTKCYWTLIKTSVLMSQHADILLWIWEQLKNVMVKRRRRMLQQSSPSSCHSHQWIEHVNVNNLTQIYVLTLESRWLLHICPFLIWPVEKKPFRGNLRLNTKTVYKTKAFSNLRMDL